ncbi:MAG: 50S ribosomal protein L22, partial [Chloroflexi bacterium]|nr:50S ribosomal protein L22 [Chloroflexota bacterium]
MAEAFEVKAKVRYVQISPRKVRLVIDAVRGKGAQEALDTLRFMPQRAAESVYKLVQSAIANAEQNFGLEADELFISSIYADGGPRHRKA